MGRIVPKVYNVDLSTARALGDAPIVAPGTEIRAIYIADLPTGPTVQIAIEAKNPFRV